MRKNIQYISRRIAGPYHNVGYTIDLMADEFTKQMTVQRILMALENKTPTKERKQKVQGAKGSIFCLLDKTVAEYKNVSDISQKPDVISDIKAQKGRNNHWQRL